MDPRARVLRAAVDRFGGVDPGAIAAGVLVTVGAIVLLGGVVGAVGSVGYQLEVPSGDAVTWAGLAVGLVVLGASAYAGGWVTGRVARYDGRRNGALAGAATVVLLAAIAVIVAFSGATRDVVSTVRLPSWFTDRPTTALGVLSAAVAIVVLIVMAAIGGSSGERLHRRADDVLLDDEGPIVEGEGEAIVIRSGSGPPRERV